jgi:hypothetical protein
MLLPLAIIGSASGQDTDEPKSAEHSDERLLGIIPNYRTFPALSEYKPIPPKEKSKIAADDAFDRGTLALAALFAGHGQWTNANPTFGQGTAGYARYLWTAYIDLLVGDFMTEAIYPTILHQDPRYFRRGAGGKWSRLGYAMGQIFWTPVDSGGKQFNFSEIVGNATAVAISNAYYPEGRDAGSAVLKLGSQVGVDTAANVLKKFWPDVREKLSRSRRSVSH